MPETAQRRLVKSPPEIWSEISDAQSLAKRLSALGEVRITRIEPETAVAWEGASIRGTVELEASGWGTKVTITAERERPVDEPEPEPAAAAAAAQDTLAFDSAAIAAVSARAADDTHEPAEQTSPEPEATGTDIPPQAPSPAPREEGFLARLKGWWHTGNWPARQHEAAPDAGPAAAETHGNQTESQPPRAEATASGPAAAEMPENQTESQPPRAEATASGPAAAEMPGNRPELQPPRPEADAPDAPAARVAAPEIEPDVRATPERAPAPAPARDPELEGLLVEILDDLGAAHHRPFSRA